MNVCGDQLGQTLFAEFLFDAVGGLRNAVAKNHEHVTRLKPDGFLLVMRLGENSDNRATGPQTLRVAAVERKCGRKRIRILLRSNSGPEKKRRDMAGIDIGEAGIRFVIESVEE